MGAHWRWPIKFLSQLVISLLFGFNGWALGVGIAAERSLYRSIWALFGTTGGIALLGALGVALLLDLLAGGRTLLADPPPSSLPRLLCEASKLLNASTVFWTPLLFLRGITGTPTLWECILPLYLSGVLFANVALGPLQLRQGRFLPTFALLALSAWTAAPDVWPLTSAEVLRESRAFNRGLHLSAGVALAVCGVLQVGFWPSCGATVFVVLASAVHSFVAYRRLVPLPAVGIAAQ